YRILEQVGRGGTSVVYRAEHVRLGRQAALKLLSPGIGDADFSDRFLRESRLAASLDHPNIVPVYDAGEEDGLLYISMAFVEGAARPDVYALGCVLYEAVTGKPPFHRPSEVAVLNAHLHSPPPQVSKEAPDVPAALDPVVSKALAKAPLDRYATPGELVAAAKAAAADHRVRPRRLAASVALLLVAGLVG